jgi:hypothetical protein
VDAVAEAAQPSGVLEELEVVVGTNYYWHEKPACEHCGRAYEGKHIGKSSAGWCFSLHVYPEDGITDIDDWEQRWATGGEITDEYGTKVSVADMRLVIMARVREPKWDKPPSFFYKDWPEFHRKNQSMEGPAGLLRHVLNQRCVKHGNGTWDCFVGEFC